MVCLGNICRSPLAHGILERHVRLQIGLRCNLPEQAPGMWAINLTQEV